MKTVYIIWATVPFALLFISVRGFYKCRLRKGLREDYRFSFVQSLYSSLVLGIAIACDLMIYEPLMESYQVQDKVIEIGRFLIYPAVLLIASLIQGQFFKKKEKDLVRRKYY